MSSGLSSVVEDEIASVSGLFKNALCYTLALQAMQKTVKADGPESYLSIIVLACILIIVTAVLRIRVEHILSDTFRSDVRQGESVSLRYPVIEGPTRFCKFLLDICLSVSTQFLSVILAQWVQTLPPRTDNFMVGFIPTFVIALGLYWCVQYASASRA